MSQPETITVEVSGPDQVNVTKSGPAQVLVVNAAPSRVSVEVPEVEEIEVANVAACPVHTYNIPRSPTSDNRTPNAESAADITARTAYIQNLIDTVGIVFLPRGVYQIGKLILKNRSGLIGLSRTGVVLWVKDGLNDNAIESENLTALEARTTHYMRQNTGHADSDAHELVPEDLVLANLTIDGNGQFGGASGGNTSGGGVYLYGNKINIHNVLFSQVAGDALTLQHGNTQNAGPDGADERTHVLVPGRVRDVAIHHSGGHGLYMKRGADYVLKELQIAGTYKCGLWCESGSHWCSAHIWSTGKKYESGQATGGSTTVLQDSGASWSTDEWVGATVTNGDREAYGHVTANDGSSITAVMYDINGDAISWQATDNYVLSFPGVKVRGTMYFDFLETDSCFGRAFEYLKGSASYCTIQHLHSIGSCKAKDYINPYPTQDFYIADTNFSVGQVDGHALDGITGFLLTQRATRASIRGAKYQGYGTESCTLVDCRAYYLELVGSFWNADTCVKLGDSTDSRYVSGSKIDVYCGTAATGIDAMLYKGNRINITYEDGGSEEVTTPLTIDESAWGWGNEISEYPI